MSDKTHADAEDILNEFQKKSKSEPLEKIPKDDSYGCSHDEPHSHQTNQPEPMTSSEQMSQIPKDDSCGCSHDEPHSHQTNPPEQLIHPEQMSQIPKDDSYGCSHDEPTHDESSHTKLEENSKNESDENEKEVQSNDTKPEKSIPSSEHNVIFVGDKPLMTYVTHTLTQLAIRSTVTLKARGRKITHAADVSQMIEKRMGSVGYKVVDVRISSDLLTNDGKERKVPTIEIDLSKQ